MVARGLRHPPSEDVVVPLTDERKNLIERYTVDADEAVKPVSSRTEEPAGPAAEARTPVPSRAAGEPEAPAAEKPVSRAGQPEAPAVEDLGADAGTAVTSHAGEPEAHAAKKPARRRAEKPDDPATKKPARRRAEKPDPPAAKKPARRRAEKPKAPPAEAEPSGQRPETEAATQSHIAVEMTEEVIANRAVEVVRKARTDPATDPYPKVGMTEDQDPGTNRRVAVEATEFGAGADAEPADREEQASPAAEAEEKRLAEGRARLAAEAEVRRLSEELTRLAAGAEAVRNGPGSPRLDAPEQSGRPVEAQRTLKAVAGPLDVSPVGQADVCHVVRWRGYLTCEFLARRPDGAIVAASGTFRWRKSAPPPEDGLAREAFDRLVGELLAYGWEERGRGALWYERRFERPL